MREKGAREEYRQTRTTRHNTEARQEGGSTQQERSIPPEPKVPPRPGFRCRPNQRSLSATYICKYVCTNRCRPEQAQELGRHHSVICSVDKHANNMHVYITSLVLVIVIIVIISQLPTLYGTATENTSQDPNYNICSTHTICFCRGD